MRQSPWNLSVLELFQRRAWFCRDLDRRYVSREVDGLGATRGAAGGGGCDVSGATRQTAGEGLVDAAAVHGHEEGVDERVGHRVEVGQEHADLLQSRQTFTKSQ